LQEILPLPIIVTQDEHNKNVYHAEIKWHGHGISPDVDATDGRGVYSDFKHTFTLTVPKNVTTVNCVRGVLDGSVFKHAFSFENHE
ncbi:11347_t:CDS:2, partial [Racocetra persica]